ncbi:MAG: division/cell wall cluster transcriptional repressor MraZ [Candidatus Dormibacteria bacterium]
MRSGEPGTILPALTRRDAVSAERASFCGTYRHSVDPKGRVAVPAQLRRDLPEGSVVAPGPDRRLRIMPPSEWRREQEAFRRTAETPEQARRFLRELVGNAYPFEVDAQGRLLLSAAQRRWADIHDNAVFVGLGSAVELAGERLWRSNQPELDPDEFTRLHDLVHRADDEREFQP